MATVPVAIAEYPTAVVVAVCAQLRDRTAQCCSARCIAADSVLWFMA